MKTALISQKDLYETTSGVPRIVHHQLQMLSSLGVRVYAIAEKINEQAVMQSGGQSVKTFRWPFSGYFRRKFYADRVQAWINKHKPDLVIGHGDIFKQDILYIHNCVHLAYQLLNNKPMPDSHEVGRVHSKILNEQHFKYLVCNSELMQNDLTQRFNIPMEKTTVIYPGANYEKFNCNNSAALRKTMRSSLNFQDEDIVIGLITSGNFKKRNVKLLIDAAKSVANNFPNAKFLVAGKNKDDSYQEKVKQLGLTSRFIFAPSIEAVEQYYHASDIFVLPALIEEFGLSVSEAMSCGKPVVVSSTVGASEILEGEARNFILPKLEVSVLEEKLSELLKDKALRQRMGEQNYQVVQKYTTKGQEEKLKKILKELQII